MLKKIIYLSILILSFSINSSANNFKSSEKRVNIIELYTSQGCSSCPVADDWLNDLKDNKKLFNEFIPLAFHVTYWNFLGWKDTFSKDKFSKKQKDYSSFWNKRSVYTPQFITNGLEYRQWFTNKSLPKFKDKVTGILKVEVIKEHIKVDFEAINIKNQKIDINIAVLGFDYIVDITAGENKNRTLNHNFVVLGFQKYSSSLQKVVKKEYLIPEYIKDKNKKAVVVYLTTKKGVPIQAVGGYFE